MKHNNAYKLTADGPEATGSSLVLLLTAERLYAEKGIDAVSLREISREAAQKNTSALHYHFGSKEALISAILQLRMSEIDSLRNAYLDRVQAGGGDVCIRSAVEALVIPMASGLVSTKKNYYNRFLAAAQLHPDIDLLEYASKDMQVGFQRVYVLLERILKDLPPNILRRRFLASIAFIVFSLADFERINMRLGRQKRDFNMQRAIENLIDMVSGAMTAPVSDQVKAQLSEDASY